MADILYPFIVAESPQSLSDRFLDAAGTNFNRMFNFLKVEQETVHVFRATSTICHTRFFFTKYRHSKRRRFLIRWSIFRADSSAHTLVAR